MNARCFPATLYAACVGLLLTVLPSAGLRAAEANPDDAAAIAAAADGLRQAARFPWYDADTRSNAAPDAATLQIPAPAGRLAVADAANRLDQTGCWLWDLLQYAIWGLLIVTLGLLLLLLLRGLTRRLLPSNDLDDEDAARRVTEADRIENLPFPVKRPQADLLGETRWHYEQGNFGEAIIYLFSYELVQLDTHHLIRLAKGKTNRQYLRELTADSSLRASCGRPC